MTKEDLLTAENNAMLEFNPEYNLLKVAYSSLGHKLSPATKLKMSEAKLGLPSARKGSTHTEMARLSIKSNNAKSVKVACFDKNGNLYNYFDSISDAAADTGISRFRIARNLGRLLDNKYTFTIKTPIAWLTLTNLLELYF